VLNKTRKKIRKRDVNEHDDCGLGFMVLLWVVFRVGVEGWEENEKKKKLQLQENLKKLSPTHHIAIYIYTLTQWHRNDQQSLRKREEEEELRELRVSEILI